MKHFFPIVKILFKQIRPFTLFALALEKGRFYVV